MSGSQQKQLTLDAVEASTAPLFGELVRMQTDFYGSCKKSSLRGNDSSSLELPLESHCQVLVKIERELFYAICSAT